MEIEYSTYDTIEKYDMLFDHFEKDITNYYSLNKNKQLIYLTAGLGLTNSIHERFMKSILIEYTKVHKLSNKRKRSFIERYKSPNNIKDFISILDLNLEESFELRKAEILASIDIIDSVESLLGRIIIQRDIRNNYLHGDFNFSDEIVFEKFKEHIIDFQQVHSWSLKIIRESFTKNLSSLPDISDKLTKDKQKKK